MKRLLKNPDLISQHAQLLCQEKVKDIYDLIKDHVFKGLNYQTDKTDDELLYDDHLTKFLHQYI